MAGELGGPLPLGARHRVPELSLVPLPERKVPITECATQMLLLRLCAVTSRPDL